MTVAQLKGFAAWVFPPKLSQGSFIYFQQVKERELLTNAGPHLFSLAVGAHSGRVTSYCSPGSSQPSSF